MHSIDILSRTQRIVVDSSKRVTLTGGNRHVSVVNAGPPGPPGPPGEDTSKSEAKGTILIPSLTWVMDYELDYPAAFRFFDEAGQEWEPEQLVYVNEHRSIAQWPEPIAGSWYVS